MTPPEQHDPRVQRANELYWESQLSVNQIADDMDVSKGMLYGLIQPVGAGLPCPSCSSEMEYTNRTARDRGFLACAACGLEQDEEEVRSELPDTDTHDPGTYDPGFRPTLRRPRDPLVFGAGLLLVAAGVWLFRRLPRH